MEDRILTQHPEKKKGVNIRRDKYNLVRSTIEAPLREEGTQTFQTLGEAVNQKLTGKFDGSIGWYFTTVKLDMGVRGVIVCECKSGQPQMIRLA
jgi:hypothetical protein